MNYVEWFDLSVSNEYPKPGEDLTITGKFNIWNPIWWPRDGKVSLVIDEAVISETTVQRTDYFEYGFSFAFRAPYVPGPYTYWIEYGAHRSPPIGIEVVTPPPKPIETYYGVEIFFDPATGTYYFTWAGTKHWAATLGEARAMIDELLGVPPPPPPPPFPWEKVLFLTGVGLIGLGVIMAVRP